jgi:acetoin utilization deacetylase AcuC-like enzyme
VKDALEICEVPPAPVADLELAHGRMYVAALRGMTDHLREEIDAGGPTHEAVDPDTSINVHTWDAALRAAGAGAIDGLVMIRGSL